MSDLFEKRPSPIHGFGLFAKVTIPLGTQLWYWTGKEMSYQDFKNEYAGDPCLWRYVYRRMPWQNVIVCKDPELRAQNMITWVNCGVHGQTHPKVNAILKKRWLITTQEIQKDEEILLDYGKKYWTGV